MVKEPISTVAALLGSRICHDLISPIGAISNGVELLGLSGTSDTSELSLISDSVDNANARVKFFRIAFGQASAGQFSSSAEMSAILSALGTARLTYSWAVTGDQSRDEVKMAALMMMCLETALPRGGKITVERSDDGHWSVCARAERLEPDPALWARLGQITDIEDLRPADVQFFLAPVQAALLGRRITHIATEGMLRLSA
ncbi:histidine phosphotransferase family protein [Celeribacter sp.]|uniref:histidine phosphotransferase family protein n=1 Tax=Celeribacter sp. TaxID=1890673 RepID=UPI003A918E4F